MTRYSRADIGLRPVSGLTRLDPPKVTGLVFHWPAINTPVHGPANVMRALRGWQDYHQGKGWADIAYQEAIDQAGNSYVLRGLRFRPAANGDRPANERNGALLLVVANGEQLTPELLATARRRVARHRELFTRSDELLGHSQVRPEPTACPGPAVMRAIRDGQLTPKAGR